MATTNVRACATGEVGKLYACAPATPCEQQTRCAVGLVEIADFPKRRHGERSPRFECAHADSLARGTWRAFLASPQMRQHACLS